MVRHHEILLFTSFLSLQYSVSFNLVEETSWIQLILFLTFFPLNYHKNFVDCSKINLNLCEIVRKMTFQGLNFGNYTRLSLIWRYANKMKFWKGYFPRNFFNFFYFHKKENLISLLNQSNIVWNVFLTLPQIW